MQRRLHLLTAQRIARTASPTRTLTRNHLPASPAWLQVTINLRDCVVEDFDAASQPSQKRSTQKLDNKAGGTVSLLIRISHKVGAAGGGGALWAAQKAGAARQPLHNGSEQSR